MPNRTLHNCQCSIKIWPCARSSVLTPVLRIRTCSLPGMSVVPGCGCGLGLKQVLVSLQEQQAPGQPWWSGTVKYIASKPRSSARAVSFASSAQTPLVSPLLGVTTVYTGCDLALAPHPMQRTCVTVCAALPGPSRCDVQ